MTVIQNQADDAHANEGARPHANKEHPVPFEVALQTERELDGQIEAEHPNREPLSFVSQEQLP